MNFYLLPHPPNFCESDIIKQTSKVIFKQKGHVCLWRLVVMTEWSMVCCYHQRPRENKPLLTEYLEYQIPKIYKCLTLYSTLLFAIQFSKFIFQHLFSSCYMITLEKEMATHSSSLAWRVLGMGEPGGLQSVGSHRVGHD